MLSLFSQWVYWHQWGIRNTQHSEVCAYSVEQSLFSVALLKLAELVTVCLVKIAVPFLKDAAIESLNLPDVKHLSTVFLSQMFEADCRGLLFVFFFSLMKLINQSWTPALPWSWQIKSDGGWLVSVPDSSLCCCSIGKVMEASEWQLVVWTARELKKQSGRCSSKSIFVMFKIIKKI